MLLLNLALGLLFSTKVLFARPQRQRPCFDIKCLQSLQFSDPDKVDQTCRDYFEVLRPDCQCCGGHATFVVHGKVCRRFCVFKECKLKPGIPELDRYQDRYEEDDFRVREVPQRIPFNNITCQADTSESQEAENGPLATQPSNSTVVVVAPIKVTTTTTAQEAFLSTTTTTIPASRRRQKPSKPTKAPEVSFEQPSETQNLPNSGQLHSTPEPFNVHDSNSEDDDTAESLPDIDLRGIPSDITNFKPPSKVSRNNVPEAEVELRHNPLDVLFG